MLHELGLWRSCRILGPRHAFHLVRRRGQRAGRAYRTRLAASILFVSQQASSSTISDVLAPAGAIPASNIVLPSVSDTGLPDIGLPAACVNTGLLTYAC
jgi:hypothetical protein